MNSLNLQSVTGLSLGECEQSESSKCDWSESWGSVNSLNLQSVTGLSLGGK